MAFEFQFHLPMKDGGSLSFNMKEGDSLFVLGANGTGKSSLISYLVRHCPVSTKRISAHRQSWFESNTLDMTPNARSNYDNQLRSLNNDPRSRYVEFNAALRPSIAIFDLIDAETLLNKKIAELVREMRVEEALTTGKEPSPIHTINELMHLSNIPVSIDVQEGQKVVARKNNGPEYSIAELSDGERNAFLVAAEVLTAKHDSVIFIDEPERHLHRSIISPLLSLLFRQRPDCAFIVSTHEVMLPVDNPSSRTILVRSCEYHGNQPAAWEATLLGPSILIDETLKADILGARRKIIFVEGTGKSLDVPLYSLLFPNVSVISKTGCREVEQAVRGIRSTEDQHWVKAWGIVDNDRRHPDEIEKLRELGVFAVPHYSVESLYYHPHIVQKLCATHAALTGKSGEAVFESVIDAALPELERKKEHLVSAAVERLVRREIFERLPTRSDVKIIERHAVDVDVADLRKQESEAFDALIQARNLDSLVSRYPIRESGVLKTIATTVGFKNRDDYEAAVRTLIQADNNAMDFLRSLFDELYIKALGPST